MSMMAAPNRSLMTGRVERVDHVENQPKWYFTVQVLDTEALEGGTFVHTGDTARVFRVADEPGLAAGDVFRAEVEYIGGAHGGEVQLHQLLEHATPGDDEAARE